MSYADIDLEIVPGSGTDFEKPARHFLPSANLRERPVAKRIEIGLERLLVRGQLRRSSANGVSVLFVMIGRPYAVVHLEPGHHGEFHGRDPASNECQIAFLVELRGAYIGIWIGILQWSGGRKVNDCGAHSPVFDFSARMVAVDYPG